MPKTMKTESAKVGMLGCARSAQCEGFMFGLCYGGDVGWQLRQLSMFIDAFFDDAGACGSRRAEPDQPTRATPQLSLDDQIFCVELRHATRHSTMAFASMFWDLPDGK
jgi:hypothetical protein